MKAERPTSNVQHPTSKWRFAPSAVGFGSGGTPLLLLILAVALGAIAPHPALAGAPGAGSFPWVESLAAAVTGVPSPGASSSSGVDGDFVLKWILAFSVLGNFIQMVLRFRGGGEKRELTNDPLRVEAMKEFASQNSLQEHVREDRLEHHQMRENMLKELKGVYDRIEDTRENILSAGREREKTIGHALDKLTSIVGELRGQLAEISKRIK